MLDNIYILTDTELRNRIAAKIKTVRLKQNMSQAELADKSGVSISTIKRMEDGVQAGENRNAVLQRVVGFVRFFER